MSSSYTAKDITVLQGLDPVRKRPGMYIGGTGSEGYHHLLWEVVDNCVDEAMNGHATTIHVELSEDRKSATVTDNGRGIPIDEHPVHKKSALELILTTLHAGGKFDQKSYRTSGGLHGVGASVVNALSKRMQVQVKRDGVTHQQIFARGKPRTELKELGAARGTGTAIQFTPDPRIFGEELCFDPRRVASHLETRSYLHRGLRIVFKDRGDDGPVQEYKHDEGLIEYLDRLIGGSSYTRVHEEPFVLEQDDDPRVEVVMAWTSATQDRYHSFVNGIRTRDGGTHEQGVKDAVAKALRSYFDTHDKLLPKGVNPSAEEIREGLMVVVSVFLAEPQFQGQTKARLNNPELRGILDGLVRGALESWLHSNPSLGQAVAKRVEEAVRTRAAAKAASNRVRIKAAAARRVQLPGKLADCSSNEPERRELFLVEGESAGGSAKQGRLREIQAVLPLRGKVLNVEQASLAKVLKNKELQDLVQALGCGIGKDFDLERLRYGKIVLLMDADSDGHHIATLLLTFFFRHMRRLIDDGRIYLGQPPLYRIDVGDTTYWALDDVERERLMAQLGPKAKKAEIMRFKGLGEMPPKVLFETTLCPSRRRLLRVIIPDEAEDLTQQVIEELMGRDAAPRFRLIQEGAAQLQGLDV